jgi:hypothetical protein
MQRQERMSDSTQKSRACHSVRQYTAHLKEILQGRTATIDESDRKTVADPSLKEGAAHSPGYRPQATVIDHSSASGRRVAVTANPMQSVEGHLQKKTRTRLARLIVQTENLAKLNQIFLAFLPPHLHEHATLARLDSESWVVQTDSPAWATRLRYILPSLRQPLSEQLGIPIPSPRIRIAPPAVPLPSPSPPRHMTISDKTVNILESTARNFSDPQLGAALQRLAESARERSRKSKRSRLTKK